MFLSDTELSENRIELARKERLGAGLPLADLTDSNPTRLGLLFPEEILQAGAAKYFARRRYSPEPQGLLEARQAIAAYYAQRKPPLKLSPEQIFITAGTSEAYSHIFSLLCDAGDELLGPGITYPLFEMLAQHSRLHYCSYTVTQAPSCISDSEISSLIGPRSRLLMFISPHNPLGRVVEAPSAVLLEAKPPLICDEVFSEFPYAISAVPPLGCFYPGQPVFHLNGISKMFGLPDLKLGWIALNEPAMEQYGERLAFLNDAFLSCSTLTQSMLPDIFLQGAEFTETLRERIRSNIELALSLLKGSSTIKDDPPQGGAFLFLELLSSVEEEELVISLIKKGVYLHPGFFYGSEGKSRLMVSCLIEPQTLRQGLEVLAEVLR